MRGTGLRVTALALVLPLASVAAASEATRPTTAQWSTLQQVALGSARTTLHERVKALPLAANLTVADWLSGNEAGDRALRLWLRAQPRHGAVRQYDDGVCEVDVRLSPTDLRDKLVQINTEYPHTGDTSRLSEKRLRAGSADWPILWTTGQARLSRQMKTARYPGWADVTAEGTVLARRAAEADALHSLFTTAGQLQVTPARRLREFLESSDAVHSNVRTALRREATVRVEFEPDQLAVATARIGMKELLRILTRVHADQYAGTDFAAADFREMLLVSGRDDLVASGLAPPPRQARIDARYKLIEYNAPTWARRTATAEGLYIPVEDDTTNKATRIAAARADGIDNLRLRIENLVIQDEVTVAAFVGYHQELKEDIVRFLSGARITKSPRVGPDGDVKLTVELPLQRLWEIVRREMEMEEVEPSETASEETP